MKLVRMYYICLCFLAVPPLHCLFIPAFSSLRAIKMLLLKPFTRPIYGRVT